ncbi:propionyl-CoA--succinate CoA transferase, partial [Burkholderia multivorans]
QDGMLDLIDSGKLTSVSATAFSLSAERAADFNENIEAYKGRILLRTQEMSNHPEAVRRLGVVAINGMVEADIYG